METLTNLESFVRSADFGSFSAAARRLGLTPAAVSRNVAHLEGRLGVRLFQRSTRRLTLTESGERFLQSVRSGLDGIQAAIADLSSAAGQPAGTLRVSMPPAFALEYLLPLLPPFLARYPAVLPDWRLDNRAVDLIAEGFDAAIGGGFELKPGVVARRLAPAHLVAVAAPAYLAGRPLPATAAGLAVLDGIVMRSPRSGRVAERGLRNARGEEQPLLQSARVVLDDPQGLRQCALMGLGVALLALPDVLPHLQSGALVRLLPGWYADAGSISLYFAAQPLLPAKTRAFIDFVVERFAGEDLSRRFDAA